MLHEQKYRLLVYIDGIYLRGYTFLNLESQFESEEHSFEIEKLYVHRHFQGKGIGQYNFELGNKMIENCVPGFGGT